MKYSKDYDFDEKQLVSDIKVGIVLLIIVIYKSIVKL